MFGLRADAGLLSTSRAVGLVDAAPDARLVAPDPWRSPVNDLLGTLGRWFSQLTFLLAVSPWEQVLRVRGGKHVTVLSAGLHLRIPFLDVVYRQSVRRRMAHMCTQTLCTKDGRTCIVGAALGYSIANIQQLYEGLHHGEDTLTNMTAAAVAAFVHAHRHEDVTPSSISASVSAELGPKFQAFGLADVDVRLTDFAYLKAYRLVQDSRWTSNTDFLNTTTQAGGGV